MEKTATVIRTNFDDAIDMFRDQIASGNWTPIELASACAKTFSKPCDEINPHSIITCHQLEQSASLWEQFEKDRDELRSQNKGVTSGWLEKWCSDRGENVTYWAQYMQDRHNSIDGYVIKLQINNT